MNAVRTRNAWIVPLTRGNRKRFEDKSSSLVTTNSVTLAPASTALIMASVAKKEKKVI